ncbi:MAG: MarR family transcriptional regulator, partial [Defluviicoccus sp.]|nr:MarR family transcriptional regulator [Defluviicoccus sp.]
FYCGTTRKSLEARVDEHNAGALAGYTATRRPVELVWHEAFQRAADAIAMERRVKGWSRRKKIALIEGDWDGLKRAARKRSFDTPPEGATQDEGIHTSPSSRVGATAPYRGTGGTQDEGVSSFPSSRVGAKRRIEGPSPSLGILPGLLGYQLRHANLKVVGGFAERIARHNVTAAQFGLLVLVGANPGATQAALARAFRTDRSAMVRLIDRLEAAGLVDRRAREGDRRSNAIVLTGRGAALLKTLKREVRAFEDKVTACLTADETETLLALLRRINAAPDGRETPE